MAGRGPAPTPTAILEARGSWRAGERKKAGEPEYDGTVGDCPATLTGEAAEEWRRIMPLITASGVAKPPDRQALIAYCELWADFISARDAFSEVEKSKDRDIHTYAKAMATKRAAAAEFLKAAQQFGLTPASRARVVAQPDGKKDKDKSKFFRAVG